MDINLKSTKRHTSAHFLKYPALRNIFIICLLIAVLIPTYSTYTILPKFHTQLTNNTEEDASRVARFLSSYILPANEGLTRELFKESVANQINMAMNDFKLEKIKVFSESGEVVYSSDKKDLGIINTKPYFLDQVAKGEAFSKIVNKFEQTVEGRFITRDVAEIYIPIMQEENFKGAFELYYDITDRKDILTTLLTTSSAALYFIAAIFLITAITMLSKIGHAVNKQELAEKELRTSNEHLEVLIQDQTLEISATQEISIETLAILAEYYDTYTGEHLSNIKEYVTLLTTWLCENPPHDNYICDSNCYTSNIALASLLHDIGKVAIPKEIITKPDKLSGDEFEIIKSHTLIAGELLNKANESFTQRFRKDSYLALARDIALHHHEKWDGTGYPYGYKGEEIPLSARIVALADVYDALRSIRPYKNAFSHKEAVKEILDCSGKHFDPDIVKAFLAQSDEFERISTLALQATKKDTLTLPAIAV